MKKIIISCVIIFILIIGIIVSKNWNKEEENNGLTKVTVAEPTPT